MGSFCWILAFVIQVMAEESYLELYDEVNYGGEKYVVRETDNDLNPFSDKASSFKVRYFPIQYHLYLKQNLN